MSSVLASLEANAPTGKAKTTDEKIKAIEDYLVQLLEQFRWTLNNLSADNFNEKEVVSWLNETITEPIQVAIQSAEEDMRTEIQASAEGVTLDIHREYAVAWVSGTAYKVGDIIKRETTNIDGTVNVGFYRCTQAHTAADNNRPPTGAYWASYWSVTQATDVLHTRFDATASEIRSEVARATDAEGNLSSAITQSANDIRLEVKGGYADEWTSGSTYYTKDVVKVTTSSGGTVTAVNFYKCKYAGSHTAAAANKPGTTGGASYWDSIPNANIQSVIDLNLEGITLSYDNGQVGANEHNASYIKLTKDGTEIAGGKVFIKDLDASTIKTGTLDAGNVILQEAFTVKAKDSHNVMQDCGFIGGYARSGGTNTITIADPAGKQTVEIEDTGVYLSSEGSGETNSYVSVEPDLVEFACYTDHNNGCLMEISPTGIRASKKTSGSWGSWVTLL